MEKVSHKTNFHVQASCRIGEKLAFNISSFENNQKRKKQKHQKLELNLHIVTSLYFLKLKRLMFLQGKFDKQPFDHRPNSWIPHSHQPNTQMRTLRTFLCYYSWSLFFLTIWSGIYKDTISLHCSHHSTKETSNFQ